MYNTQPVCIISICLSRFLKSLAPTHFQFAFDATGSDDRMSQLKPNKGAGGGGWGLGLHDL